MTLAERLAAKSRRRVVVPVDVDPSAERDARVAELQARAMASASAGETGALDGLVEQVEAIRREGQVDVAFVATDGATFEKIAGAYPSEDGSDSGMDWRAALPVVAALCAEDESLQDDETWRGLLDSWSHGERLTLWSALLRLNTAAPAPHLPKG